jgi:hypothetical protein
MREVLGAGRGVQAGEVETLAMAARARRATRQGAEGDEEGDGGNGVHDSDERRARTLMITHHIRLYIHAEPQAARLYHSS